ncbi:MAG: aldehyde dehydrogenase family protein [Bacteroidetes bacterium]|nr:aldehyde dehydrogenase family protein [Bacteroidota bacterium]
MEKHWIGGKYVRAELGDQFTTVSPAHDTTVNSYALGTAKDIHRAVQSAREAFDSGPWPHMSGKERADILINIAHQILANCDELAELETLESGKPITQAHDEIKTAVDVWHYAATLARQLSGETYNHLGPQKLGFVLREPAGVVGLITPWNFPLLIISQKLPFALAAGCTSVIKPSELTPGTTLKLASYAHEAGVPSGVINVVTGFGDPVGACLSEQPDIDVISFTGSTEVGRKVAATAGKNLKRCSLELGGKNPHIIFADADQDAALDPVVFGVYFNMGECCNSGSRVLLEESIAEEFTQRIIDYSRKIPVGDPLSAEVKVGAIINNAHLDKINHYIQSGTACGARLRLGGSQLPTLNGRFFEPTVFDQVTGDMPIARQEVFGPVLSILTFKTKEEAIQIANDTMYGLSAGLWTSNVDTAFEVSRNIRAGTIWINCFMDGHPELPFGGYKDSGLGRELGRFSTDEFTELKTVQLHIGKHSHTWL